MLYFFIGSTNRYGEKLCREGTSGAVVKIGGVCKKMVSREENTLFKSPRLIFLKVDVIQASENG